MKTTIHTPYDCLIKTDKQELFLLRNESFSFQQTEKFYVYPSQNKLAFVIDDRFSTFYYIIEKEDVKHIFLLDGLIMQDVEIHTPSFSGGSIEKHADKIVFICKQRKKIIPFLNHYKEVSIGSNFHIGYALFSSKQNNSIVFFNFKNGNSKIFEGERIECDSPHFEIFNKGKKCTLLITKEGLKQQDKKPVVILENPLFPYLSFLQALKEKNYSFCHSLLAETLQQNQTEDDIKAFFGTVNFFQPISYNQAFVFSEGKGEIYSFNYHNGKICDISND